MRIEPFSLWHAPTRTCQDRIFDELNSLAVIYRAPAATFIDAEPLGEWWWGWWWWGGGRRGC